MVKNIKSLFSVYDTLIELRGIMLVKSKDAKKYKEMAHNLRKMAKEMAT